MDKSGNVGKQEKKYYQLANKQIQGKTTKQGTIQHIKFQYCKRSKSFCIVKEAIVYKTTCLTKYRSKQRKEDKEKLKLSAYIFSSRIEWSENKKIKETP
jgi:hypothetical protein